MRVVMYSETRHALGSDVTLTLYSDAHEADMTALLESLWHEAYLFERRFSRFIPMSELMILNRSAGLKAPVSPHLRDILLAAKSMSEQTEGLYNPFILPALQRAGYTRSASPGYEADVQEDFSDRRVTTTDKLTVGADWAFIPYKTALDLGGCGKGYLADMLGDIARRVGVTGYWLSLGGDIATYGTDENGQPITVAIQNARELDDTLEAYISSPLESAAVATSGTFKRKSQYSSERWHHIIDPLTGKPAQTDVLLATVCASTATLADVLASCAVIVGSRSALSFLKKHGATAALIQYTRADGTVTTRQFGSLIHSEELQHA